jgi:hypothetical protein
MGLVVRAGDASCVVRCVHLTKSAGMEFRRSSTLAPSSSASDRPWVLCTATAGWIHGILRSMLTPVLGAWAKG